MLAAPGCGMLQRVNWDAGELQSAANKAMTALSISDEQIVQLSKEAVKQYLADHPDDCAALEEQIKSNADKLMMINANEKKKKSPAKEGVDVIVDDFEE